MARKDNITYQTVADICDALVEVGDKPSARKIHQKAGGSLSTILTYFTRWKEQWTLANSVDADLSDPFRQAVLAEFGRVTASLKDRLETQLAEEKMQLKEAQSALADEEARSEALQEEIDSLKKAAEQQRLTLEKKLAAADARNHDHEKREAAYQQQIDALREQKHASELKTARAETECHELQKRYCLLEQQMQRPGKNK
jgi:hypothetical protein